MILPDDHYPLLVTSPAIDAIPLTECLPNDQLGLDRPQGAGCDIGGYRDASRRRFCTDSHGN